MTRLSSDKTTPASDKTAPVVLITGAARRIGAEIAQTFHQQGFDVALHYNASAEDADVLAASLNAIRNDSAATFQADLTDINSIQRMTAHVFQWRNQLNVLINNASSFYPTELSKATEQDWDNLIGSNLKGPYFLCQAVAEKLRDSSGSIVSIADIYAKNPLKGYSIYCIAKAGNVMLTKSLAKELAPKVRVNGIAPGVILWPNTDEQMSDTVKQNVIDNVPLGRTGNPTDIAQLAWYLATQDSYITGQVIAVDGGSSLT